MANVRRKPRFVLAIASSTRRRRTSTSASVQTVRSLAAWLDVPGVARVVTISQAQKSRETRARLTPLSGDVALDPFLAISCRGAEYRSSAEWMHSFGRLAHGEGHYVIGGERA